MIDDLTLGEDDSGPQTPPAFYTFPPATPAELLVRERIFRFASSLAVKAILFTREDDAGEEVWDDQAEAEKWMRILAWPTLPSIADALAFKAHHVAKLEADNWDELQAARLGVP